MAVNRLVKLGRGVDSTARTSEREKTPGVRVGVPELRGAVSELERPWEAHGQAARGRGRISPLEERQGNSPRKKKKR